MRAPAQRLAITAGATALVAAWTAASPRADEPGEPIRLEYHAADGCPSEADFVARIRSRTGRARLAWPGESARTFEVNLSPGPPVSASVALRDASGNREGTRRVQAATCAEAADVTALVVALAVDPAAITTPVVPATAPVPASDAGPALDAAAVSYAAEDAPGPQAPPMPAFTPPVAPISHDDAERRPRDAPIGHYGFFAGADFTASSGVAPVAMLGASPYVGWRMLRLAFLRADSGVFAANASGTADITWTVGRIDVCPFALHLGPVIGSAGARLEVGELEAAGVTVQASQDRTRFWLAAGPVARAEWSFFGPLFVDAEAAVVFRVTQDRFYFIPQSTVEQVPLLGLTGSAGVGLHFL